MSQAIAIKKIKNRLRLIRSRLWTNENQKREGKRPRGKKSSWQSQQAPSCWKVSQLITSLAATMSIGCFFRPMLVCPSNVRTFHKQLLLSIYPQGYQQFQFSINECPLINNYLNKMKSNINMLGASMMDLVVRQTNSTLVITNIPLRVLKKWHVINKTMHPNSSLKV